MVELTCKQIKYEIEGNLSNKLTDEMNEHLLPEWKEHLKERYTTGSYIMNCFNVIDGKRYYPLRYPGATRGHVEVDENMVITDIEFHDVAYSEGIGCFEKSMEGIKQNYIGQKLVI